MFFFSSVILLSYKGIFNLFKILCFGTKSFQILKQTVMLNMYFKFIQKTFHSASHVKHSLLTFALFLVSHTNSLNAEVSEQEKVFEWRFSDQSWTCVAVETKPDITNYLGLKKRNLIG